MQTLEEFHAHYKAVRARLNGPPPVRYVEPPKIVETAPEPPAPPPAPMMEQKIYRPRTARVRAKVGDIIVTVETIETQGQMILREVAEKYAMPMTVFKDESRKKPFVLCRQEAAYRLKMEARLSLSQIGRLFGHKDHTTVLHSINRYRENLENDRIPWFKTTRTAQ